MSFVEYLRTCLGIYLQCLLCFCFLLSHSSFILTNSTLECFFFLTLLSLSRRDIMVLFSSILAPLLGLAEIQENFSLYIIIIIISISLEHSLTQFLIISTSQKLYPFVEDIHKTSSFLNPFLIPQLQWSSALAEHWNLDGGETFILKVHWAGKNGDMPLYEHFLFYLLPAFHGCHIFYNPSDMLLSISCKFGNQIVKLVTTGCTGKKKDVEWELGLPTYKASECPCSGTSTVTVAARFRALGSRQVWWDSTCRKVRAEKKLL